MRRWSFLLFAALLLTGCGGGEPADKPAGEPMTIHPTVFSEETRKVLDILDDEVMFFTYTTDETVQSMALDIWFYEDGEWVSAGAVKGEQAAVEQDVVLRVKDAEIDIIHIQENGQSKYTFPVTVEFTAAQMTVEDRLQITEDIALGKEIVLYSKVSTEDTVLRNEENFRDMDCTAGMAVTLTFSAEPAE